jgi:hypothetical protein
VIVQPRLYVPPEILTGLASGELMRIGSVVRNTAGHIVKHLDEVPNLPVQQETARRAALSLKHLGRLLDLKDPRIIAGAIVISTAAAGGVLYFVTRKQKDPAGSELSQRVKDYTASLTAYVEAVRDGTLDVGIINRLISDLDAVKDQSEDGRIVLDFSADQAADLVNLIVTYTQELAQANAVDLNELQERLPAPGGASIVDLRRHLEAQRHIFGEAA